MIFWLRDAQRSTEVPKSKDVMVTHNWGNKFSHLLAAILSEATSRLGAGNHRKNGMSERLEFMGAIMMV
jgi:hypothetical protein